MLGSSSKSAWHEAESRTILKMGFMNRHVLVSDAIAEPRFMSLEPRHRKRYAVARVVWSNFSCVRSLHSVCYEVIGISPSLPMSSPTTFKASRPSLTFGSRLPPIRWQLQ